MMSQVDGSPVTEKNMLDFAAGQGEPFLFGIEDGAAEAFFKGAMLFSGPKCHQR